MRIIPFAARHLTEISAQEPLVVPTATLLALGSVYEVSGPAFTGVVDERPVASAGLRILHPGVADAWAFISPEALRWRKTLHRHVRGCLRDAIHGLGLRRIEASTLRDAAGYCRWLESLGFQDPYLRRSYGPNGEDFLLYSMVIR